MSEIANTVKFLNKLKEKGFSNEWNLQPHKKDISLISTDLVDIFENLSKNGNGYGYPDLFYFNKVLNLLIIAEVKEHILDHGDNDFYNDQKKSITAIGGIKHYLNKILDKNISEKLKLSIVGLALSGNPEVKFNNKISTFIITKDNKISNNITEFLLSENEYKNLFLNFDKNTALTKLKSVAKNVNELMRDMPVSERPILLSGAIISLYENSNIGIEPQQIKKILTNNPLALDFEFINRNMTSDIKNILAKSGISPIDKIESVNVHINKILKNKSLMINNTLTDIFKELNSIMSILTDSLEFDVMGDFYQEFLRYSSGDGGDLGIILTPLHVTEFMTDLIDLFKDGGININDIILDPCCGTGTFLTSFMNKQINKFGSNDIGNKNYIKANNLIGVEINSTMYTLAIANMLVRGDGKSSIFEEDIFSINKKYLRNRSNKKPTIGLMNPPYSQSKKKKVGNNKSEMQFIEVLLNSLESNGYAAIISQKSTFFKSDKDYAISKENIYKNNTLKAVINMPKDLFSPHATVHTSIAVFQVGRSHQLSDEVYFYNLDHDGFQLLKNNRIDIYNKWNEIKKDALGTIKQRKIIYGKSTLVKNISFKDEWIPEAWIPIDFDKIISIEKDVLFDKVIKEYTFFKFKEKTGILEQELAYKNENNPTLKEELKNHLPSELELFELIQESGLNSFDIIEEKENG